MRLLCLWREPRHARRHDAPLPLHGAGELRALSVDDLDTERGGLTLHAEWAKNRKAGFQPLPAALVERLKAFAVTGQGRALAEKAYTRHDARRYGVPENPLLFVPTHPARAMYADLDAAGIEK